MIQFGSLRRGSTKNIITSSNHVTEWRQASRALQSHAEQKSEVAPRSKRTHQAVACDVLDGRLELCERLRRVIRDLGRNGRLAAGEQSHLHKKHTRGGAQGR